MARPRIYTPEQRKQIKKEYGKKRYNENKEKIKEYNNKYREKNKEKIKECEKKYREENKEKIREYKKKYREKNQDNERERCKKYRSTAIGIKKHRICNWKRYGIICEDWESLYEIYIYTWNCEYCETPFKNTKDRNLDHNHKTGEIRGILCRVCNFKDVLK